MIKWGKATRDKRERAFHITAETKAQMADLKVTVRDWLARKGYRFAGWESQTTYEAHGYADA